MKKETYDNFFSAGLKIIELNDILTKTIARMKADVASLSKYRSGTEHDKYISFITEEIRKFEATKDRGYLAYIILHEKMLELNNEIMLEGELEKALSG